MVVDTFGKLFEGPLNDSFESNNLQMHHMSSEVQMKGTFVDTASSAAKRKELVIFKSAHEPNHYW